MLLHAPLQNLRLVIQCSGSPEVTYRKSLEEIYFLQCSTTFSIFSVKSFRLFLHLIKVQGNSQMGGFSFSVNVKTLYITMGQMKKFIQKIKCRY